MGRSFTIPIGLRYRR